MNESPRVWVGSLAAYNAGQLVGEWFDAIDCPTDAADWLARLWGDTYSAALRCGGAGERPAPEAARYHEELWCFDHEGFGGLLEGECSPSEAQAVAQVIGGLDAWQPLEAVAAYLAHTGESAAEFDGDSFDEAYCGEYGDEQEYAEEFATELGLVPDDASWPASYIDWTRAARDLFMGDNWSAEAPGGGIYVFRSI